MQYATFGQRPQEDRLPGQPIIEQQWIVQVRLDDVVELGARPRARKPRVLGQAKRDGGYGDMTPP
ncbi:hypothetical protein, partial [Nocardia brasiliensis]|uniref:hypothetical protein n=1 Tax=Nocardia brasiliensis TaxID=37326 RepID=UPI002458B831